MLGQRPGGFALQPGQHPAQAGTGANPDLPAEEPARDQRERIIKPGLQPGSLNIVYLGQRGPPRMPDSNMFAPCGLLTP
jgi:hypothetical protein